MSDGIAIRPADAQDAPDLARLVVMAGGGVFDFLLEGMAPGLTTAEMLAPGIAATAGSFSHRQFLAAVDGDRIVGMAHAYPADWMRAMDRSGFPPDRIAHMAPFDAVQDWGSLFLSGLAVEETYRRRGIARRLLAATGQRALAAGLDRLTLHVWADNPAARALYAAEGFEELGRAAIAWHPRLPHHGGSVLLRRRLTPAPG